MDNALGMEVSIWNNGWTGLVVISCLSDNFISCLSDNIYLSAALVICLFSSGFLQ